MSLSQKWSESSFEKEAAVCQLHSLCGVKAQRQVGIHSGVNMCVFIPPKIITPYNTVNMTLWFRQSIENHT